MHYVSQKLYQCLSNTSNNSKGFEISALSCCDRDNEGVVVRKKDVVSLRINNACLIGDRQWMTCLGEEMSISTNVFHPFLVAIIAVT